MQMVKCHFCETVLHPDNNAMSRRANGLDPAPAGFGWISVIVKPFREVPCCDICMVEEGPKYREEILMV